MEWSAVFDRLFKYTLNATAAKKLDTEHPDFRRNEAANGNDQPVDRELLVTVTYSSRPLWRPS